MVSVYIRMHIYGAAGIFSILSLFLSGRQSHFCHFLLSWRSSRFLSVILTKYNVEGFDVKSLRAFRVIRPLKLVNGVPSRCECCSVACICVCAWFVVVVVLCGLCSMVKADRSLIWSLFKVFKSFWIPSWEPCYPCYISLCSFSLSLLSMPSSVWSCSVAKCIWHVITMEQVRQRSSSSIESERERENENLNKSI